MISVSGLTKYYADNLALNRVTFEVQAGDVVGFLGPNGAGKSTTMKIITCFLPPSAGTATVAGFSIIDRPMEVRRRIGYMPENVPLYTEMRVREYLTFRARIKDVPRKGRKERVEKVMDRCWLTSVARQTIGTLSKGYRQRVGLADAMISDPEILILDEPTIGLDPNQVRQVRSLIRELGSDHTVLLSTHILPEVEVVCDKVIIINGGRIAMQDSLDSLRRGTGPTVDYYLEVNGPADAARAVLATVAGLEGLQENTPHHGGAKIAGFAFKVARDSGGAEEAAARIVKNGWGVRELRRKERTLEDVFVEVVGREIQTGV
jgi:ABC-2 type transport system ATP-binding protein